MAAEQAVAADGAGRMAFRELKSVEPAPLLSCGVRRQFRDPSLFKERFMDRRFVIGLTVVAILVAGAWGLTQAQQPGGKQPPASEQFLVSPAGETAVLLDTKSGKTWV